jgi:hypothetical protein
VGYALMIGFLYAKKYNFDFLVHLAGNGKMNPKQIDRFIRLNNSKKIMILFQEVDF